MGLEQATHLHVGGRRHDQHERYFVPKSKEVTLAPPKVDSYVVGHCWWDLNELEQSKCARCIPRRTRMDARPLLWLRIARWVHAIFQRVKKSS